MNDTEIKSLLNNDFRGILLEPLERISSSKGVESMIDYFEKTKYQSSDKSADSDMLLFQIGTYNWGNGNYFEYDITRQVIFESKSRMDDDSIFQVSLTFKYEAEKYTTVESSHKWSTDFKNVMNEFRNYINSMPISNLVRGETPVEVNLSIEQQ